MTDWSASAQGGEPRASLHAGEAGPVDIVIVNWNSGEQLAACLRSVAEYGGRDVASVVVVDNGSRDGSDQVEVPGLPLEVIRTGENLGFGRACNLGARRGTAPYLLFLNPDAELRADAIGRAVAWLDTPGHERTGVVGVRLVGASGEVHRHCARFPTWRSFIGNSLGLTRILRPWFPPILMLDFDHRTSRPVDHVMGAFYLIRRELFERLAGFDEDFFVYLEDLDLSRRVSRAGYDIYYLAEAEAYHKQGGTSDQVKAHRLLYALNSNMIYAAKHLSPTAAGVVTAVTLTIEPVSRSFRALFRRSVEELRFTWQGFGMIYRDLPRTWALLRGVKARRTNGRAGQ
jgi:N-acetylglucosaminyl-diphospho-decaprenol L-rhamnosyltransferase